MRLNQSTTHSGEQMSDAVSTSESSNNEIVLNDWNNSIKAIATFLQPILTRESGSVAPSKQSFTERLAQNVPDHEATPDHLAGTSASHKVIQFALHLFDGVMRALSKLVDSDSIYAPKDIRYIYALLDLISLEGIYQNVTDGLGIPLERRAKPQISSVLKTNKQNGTQVIDRKMLADICACLDKIDQFGIHNDMLALIQDRARADRLTARAELAFNPVHESEDYKKQFFSELEKVPTSILLPYLTLTIHTTSPVWYRQPVTRYLSLIPYSRSNGVKDTITFLVNTSSGNDMKLEDLQRASKLIGSLPSTVPTNEEYFPKIAEQLFLLLDVPSSESSISQAAAFIIGDIVTRRRSLIVSRIFFSPIVDQIRPTVYKIEASHTEELVTELDLERALKRLALIVSHPNPALTKSLFRPCYIPLWGIYVFAKNNSKSRWTELLFDLLRSYMKVSGDLSDLTLLAHNINHSESRKWSYGNGDLGGISIWKRTSTEDYGINPQEVDSRVEAFMDLLENVEQSVITSFFLTLLKNWLQGNKEKSEEEDDPIKTYANLKLLASMMDKYSENVIREPKETLDLIQQILDDFVTSARTRESKKHISSKPSFYTLSHIVDEYNETNDSEEDTDVLTIALNLLTLIATSEEQDGRNTDVLASFKHMMEPLQYIAYSSQTSSSVSGIAMNILTLLNYQNNVPERSGSNSNVRSETLQNTKQPSDDREKLSRVFEYIQDSLIPIRAQGLHILQGLIEAKSPILDIPQTVELLISMLQDQESFIYLNVIKCLAAITDRHYHTVIQALLSSYIDKEQKLTIDARLKIGEALLKTVERQGQATTAEDAERIGDAMIILVGRRNKRDKERLEIKTRREVLEAQKPSMEDQKEYAEIMKQVETELGLVDVAAKSGGGSDDDDDQKKEDVFTEEERWISTQGEEDIRVRTSALSILGALLETNIHAASGRILAQSIDPALHILTVEREDNRVTLRRAALVLILSVLKGVEKNPNRSTEYLLLARESQNMRRIVSYVRLTDNDGLVREQAGVVLEGLENLTGVMTLENLTSGTLI